MGDLERDTRVEPLGAGRFVAVLSPDWDIWGPNGGYLATVAMRAAGLVSERARPASINAHFVGTGSAGPVELDVEVNRRTRVATSLTVRMAQNGRPWVVAQVWAVDDDLEGLGHQPGERSTLPPEPTSLPRFEDLVPAADLVDRHPFWHNLDQRPVGWIGNWDEREASEPLKQVWYRFVPAETFDDPWVDAGRSLILIDLDAWPATCLAHVGELDVFAPTIEVTARFCVDTRREPWLLGRAHAPLAASGLVAATAEIWTPGGRLVALGGSTLLCRPVERRPDQLYSS